MKRLQIALTILFSVTALTCYGQTKTDSTKGGVTADQQKENTADRNLTRKIRQSVIADKNLSTDAHNVKIISQNGIVTLKGPVKSEDERKAIVAKAVEIAGGADKVTDQITIKQ